MIVEYLFIIGFILSLLSLIYVIGIQIIKNDINTPTLKLIISILIVFFTLINTYYVYKGIFIATNSLAISILISFIVQITIALSFIKLPSIKNRMNILHLILIVILSLSVSLLSVYNYSYSKKIVYKEIDKTLLNDAYHTLLTKLQIIKETSDELLFRKEEIKQSMNDEEKGLGEDGRAGRGEIWKKMNSSYQKANIEYKVVNNYYNKIVYDHEKLKNMFKNNTTPYETYILALKIDEKLKESDKSFSVNGVNINRPISSLFEGNVGYSIFLYTVQNWLYTLISIILGFFLFFMYRENSPNKTFEGTN